MLGAGASRTRSNSKVNDRLQERLARAMVSRDKSADGRGRASPSVPSRAASPALSSHASLTEVDPQAKSLEALEAGSDLANHDTPLAGAEEHAKRNGLPSNARIDRSLSPSTSQQAKTPAASTAPASRDRSHQPSQVNAGAGRAIEVGTGSVGDGTDRDLPDATPEGSDSKLAQLRSDYEVSELQRQDEMHQYTERIDALQAKLQYLSKEVAESARNAATTAPAGSLERKLAEKDEQIALLMKEGQELSKTELKHTTTIKKLRAKVGENEKLLSDAKAKQERAEKDAVDLKEKVKRVETAEKRAIEKQQSLSKMEKTVDELTAQRDADSKLIKALKTQIADAAARATKEGTEAQKAELEKSRNQIQELSTELSNARAENEMVEEKAQGQIRSLKQKLEHERERAKIAELTLREEQSVSSVVSLHYNKC